MAKERKTKTKDEYYYPVYYWMSKLTVINEKGEKSPLSGVAKDLYAIIYRFSCGRNGCCTMSFDSLKEVTGASLSTIRRNLETLERSGLIEIETVKVPALTENAKKDNIIGKRYRTKADTLEDLGNKLGISLAEKLRANESSATGWNDYIKEPEEDLS